MRPKEIWDSLFETGSHSSERPEVQKKPVVRKPEKLNYVDIEDLGDKLRVTIIIVGCESADCDCIGKPTSDPKILISEEMRIERKAKKADKGSTYLHRGIMPQDTIDIVSLGCQVVAETDLQNKGKTDVTPGALVFTLTKVVPTGRASFTF